MEVLSLGPSATFSNISKYLVLMSCHTFPLRQLRSVESLTREQYAVIDDRE